MGNYSVIGDILAVVLTVVLLVVFRFLYHNASRESFLIKLALIFLLVGTYCHMFLYFIIAYTDINSPLLCNIFLDIYYLSLMTVMGFYVIYTSLVVMTPQALRRIRVFIFSINIILGLLFVTAPLTGRGHYFNAQNELVTTMKYGWFAILYFIYIVTCVTMFLLNKRHIERKIFYCLFITCFIAVSLVLIQSHFNNSSFTAFSMIIPILSVAMLLHTNSIDLDTGSLNADSFDDFIKSNYNNPTDWDFILSLEFDNTFLDERRLAYSRDFYTDRNELCQYTTRLFKHSMIFGRNYIYTTIVKGMTLEEMQAALQKASDRYHAFSKKHEIHYHCLVIPLPVNFSTYQSYYTFERYVFDKTSQDCAYYVTPDDISRFKRQSQITAQLSDIKFENNLDDNRVLAYYQPVLSLSNDSFKSAEALMRLELPELGIVFPDEFIPIAEDMNMIHSLSMIMLNKICKIANQLPNSSSTVEHISINFSTIELLDTNFYQDVIHIITANRTPFYRIAAEITETTYSKYYKDIITNINQLRMRGMLFYLDDFGTGYSNFSRISHLPFDVIKFDRSILISMQEDGVLSSLIVTLSDMFAQCGYTILFEGIETQEDEDLCRELNFHMLQGYKYSKPVPIEEILK